MLDRFSETALNEAKQYYEEQGFRSSWSENTKTMVLSVLNNGLDYGHLMLDMASIVAWVPRIRCFFDELYKTDKIRFFINARNHELYDSFRFTDKNLAMEVSMRRAFGILMCSLDDEELLTKIIKCIEKEYLWIKTLSKKFNSDEYEKKVLSMGKSSSVKSPQDGSLEMVLFYFVLFCKYGYTTRKADIWKFYSSLNEMQGGYHNGYVNEEVLDKNDYDLSKISTKEFKKLQNALVTGGDLVKLSAIVDCALGDASEYKYDEKVSTLQNLLENANSDMYELTLSKIILFKQVLLLNGLNFQEFLWEYKTDSLGRERLAKAVSIARRTISSFSFDSIETDIIDTDDYLTALCFDFLAKAIQHSREFYFKNNSETEYYEIQNYQNKTADMELEIEKFNSALAEKDSEIEFLKKQIEDLKTAESKEAKDIVKPYNEEISFLKKQVEDLSKKLSDEQKKSDELNKLRTFAFSVQSEDVIEEKEISLSELIKDKKITIVGGHINWRNKMKKKYPKLNLLDGHSTSFDVQTLTSSDVVLLHTGNMSHTVYYKMIDELRTSDIKYDYIGKYNNVNLLEQEIAEILK